MTRYAAKLTSALAALVLVTGIPEHSKASTDAPWVARSVGFSVNTFTSDFTPTTVDLSQTYKSGFNWYAYNFFGVRTVTSAITLNSDHSVSVTYNPDVLNAALASAGAMPNAPFFVGTGFGGGGYFEATIKFNPAQVAAARFKGWPTWWGLPLEHIALSQDQWTNASPGYLHFLETDYFEADIITSGSQVAYGGETHDWSGIWNTTCAPSAFCDYHPAYSSYVHYLATGTDMTQYHKYGFLWVPATATSKGYVQYYFDRIQVGPTIYWSQYNTPVPPAYHGAPWLYGVGDKEHFVMMFGSGVAPMTIASLQVWQASNVNNIHN